MGLRTEQIKRNAEKAVRRAAVAADTWVVLATPVDTGRARANWLTSIGSIGKETTQDTDGDGTATINASTRKIEQWSLGRGTIYITNSLPYIGLLDKGSSAQRPEGMTAGAIQAAQHQLDNAHLLK